MKSLQFALLLLLGFAATAVAQSESVSLESAEATPVMPLKIGPRCGIPDPNAGTTSGEESAPAVEAGPSGTLEVIFDCSNSMNARMGGVPKIDLAKDALYALTDKLADARLKLGFRVFGHDQSIDREDRPRACVNSELVIPIGEGHAEKIRARIPSLIAWGRTPIAYSLEEAGKDLDPYLEESPMILLISDGVESCDQDPLQAIEGLKQRGVNVRTFVIGFDLNAEERTALEQIAAIGDGKYYNARNYGELLRSFDDFMRDVNMAPEPKAPERYNNPAQGGASFEEAVSIEAGRYTVWKDLDKGEWAYFKVDSSKAQRVVVKQMLQGKGLYRDKDGNLQEHAHKISSGMLKIFNAEGKEVRGSKVTGAPGEWCQQHALDTTGQGIVFAVGNAYDAFSRHIVFEIVLEEAGDLNEGWEAPNSVESDSLIVAPFGNAFYGHLGTEDKQDVYRLDLAAAGSPETVKMTLELTPTHQWGGVNRKPSEFRAQVEVLDGETKRRLVRQIVDGKAELEIATEGLKSALVVIKDGTVGLYHMLSSYELTFETP